MPSLLQPTVQLDAIAHKNVEDAHICLNPWEVLCTSDMCVSNYSMYILSKSCVLLCLIALFHTVDLLSL